MNVHIGKACAIGISISLLILLIPTGISSGSNPVTIPDKDPGYGRYLGNIVYENNFDRYPGVESTTAPYGNQSEVLLRPIQWRYWARGQINVTDWGMKDQLYDDEGLFVYNGVFHAKDYPNVTNSQDANNLVASLSSDVFEDGNINFTLDDDYNMDEWTVEFDYMIDSSQQLQESATTSGYADWRSMQLQNSDFSGNSILLWVGCWGTNDNHIHVKNVAGTRNAGGAIWVGEWYHVVFNVDYSANTVRGILINETDTITVSVIDPTMVLYNNWTLTFRNNFNGETGITYVNHSFDNFVMYTGNAYLSCKDHHYTEVNETLQINATYNHEGQPITSGATVTLWDGESEYPLTYSPSTEKYTINYLPGDLATIKEVQINASHSTYTDTYRKIWIQVNDTYNGRYEGITKFFNNLQFSTSVEQDDVMSGTPLSSWSSSYEHPFTSCYMDHPTSGELLSHYSGPHEVANHDMGDGSGVYGGEQPSPPNFPYTCHPRMEPVRGWYNYPNMSAHHRVTQENFSSWKVNRWAENGQMITNAQAYNVANRYQLYATFDNGMRPGGWIPQSTKAPTNKWAYTDSFLDPCVYPSCLYSTFNDYVDLNQESAWIHLKTMDPQKPIDWNSQSRWSMAVDWFQIRFNYSRDNGLYLRGFHHGDYTSFNANLVETETSNMQTTPGEMYSYWITRNSVTHNIISESGSELWYNFTSEKFDNRSWNVPVTLKFNLTGISFTNFTIYNYDGSVYNRSENMTDLTNVQILDEGYKLEGDYLYITTRLSNKSIGINPTGAIPEPPEPEPESPTDQIVRESIGAISAIWPLLIFVTILGMIIAIVKKVSGMIR